MKEVLLIEDRVECKIAVISALSHCAVTATSDMKEALEIFLKKTFDLIIFKPYW